VKIINKHLQIRYEIRQKRKLIKNNMFITQTQIPTEVKKEEVFAVLDNLKNCNIKVKAYYLWLKAKNKLSEIDIEKAYNIIVTSMTEVNQEELNRKF